MPSSSSWLPCLSSVQKLVVGAAAYSLHFKFWNRLIVQDAAECAWCKDVRLDRIDVFNAYRLARPKAP